MSLGRVPFNPAARHADPRGHEKEPIMSVINWFEIPVGDIDRAARFYESVLGTTLKREDFAGVPHAIFAKTLEANTTGALVADPRHAPGASGAVLYLHAPELDASLSRVAKAGGSVVVPKTDIGPMGCYAIISDTEGNRVGLHAQAKR
jgi:predicted enzyme related to lactoylglutathione lyase